MIVSVFHWISGSLLITFNLTGFIIKKFYIKEQTVSEKLKLIRNGGWVLGVIIGICANYVPWQSSETIKIFGLPVPIAYWVLENDKWFDYVSSLIFPTMILNCILIAYAPQAAISIYLFVKEKYCTKSKLDFA